LLTQVIQNLFLQERVLSMKLKRWIDPLLVTSAFVLVLFLCAEGYAQGLAGILGKESVTARPLILLVTLASLALVPFVLIMVTSFVKIAVVLSIIRQAIGTQQIPPTQVITGLSILMTVYIMMPVGLDIYHRSQDKLIEMEIKTFDIEKLSPEELMEMSTTAQLPMRGFLMKHAHLKDRDMFYKLAWRMRVPRDRASLTDQDFSVIVPAFVISELKEAFQIGFILFVPFLVVDMIVANILMALGMQMLSPTTISLPFKILLFVLVDGWYLISKGLIVAYQ
jgi:type III secretion protein R